MALPSVPKFTPPPLIGGAASLNQITGAPAAPPQLAAGYEDPSGFFGDLAKSFQMGAVQGAEMAVQPIRGIGSGLLRSLGYDDIADRWDWNSYQMSLSTGSSVAELERQIDFPTRLEQIDGVGDFFKYGMFAIAKQAPQLTAQFATSAVAGVLSGGTLALPTFLATSYILGMGEVYSSTLAETGDPHLGPAMAAGVPIAMLDTLPWSKVIRKMGKGSDYGNWMGRNIQGKWKNRFIGAMETSTLEGSTEAVQNIFEQMAVEYVKGQGWDLQKMMADPEFRESFAQGWWVGLALGPFASTRGRAGLPPPTLPERPLPADAFKRAN